MTDRKGILLVSLLVMFAAGYSNAYISKPACFERYRLYLQPAIENRDSSGFPAFQRFLDSCSLEQKYYLFDTLKAALIDSLDERWKWDYMMEGIVVPMFLIFWEPLYLHDDAFFKYAFFQCERRVIGADPRQLTAYYPMQYFTITSVRNQRWILEKQPDSNICLKRNCGFVDSIASLIVTDGELPKSYRKYFAGMDKYADPIALKSASLSLRIDSTFKGRRIFGVYALDSSIIAVAGDTGLVALSFDAGRNWRKSAPFTVNSVTAVGFLTKAKGLCVENCMKVWSTGDSGATWQPADLPHAQYDRVIVFDSTRLMIYDSFNGNILSGDAGKTWTKTSVLYNSFTATVSGNSAYGLSGLLLRKSTDAGASWKNVLRLDSLFFPGVMTFMDERTGFVGGDPGEMAVTLDSGSHWRRCSPPTVEKIVGILRSTDRSIIAITDRFSAFSTKDTGATWTAEKLCHPSLLQSCVQTGGKRSVWVAGNGCLVLCDALSPPTSLSGRQAVKPLAAHPLRSAARTVFTLDGRSASARFRAPGVRLKRDPSGSRATVLVR